MSEIHARARRALERIVRRADQDGLRCLVLCTHAATNIALGRALTGDPEVYFDMRELLMKDGCAHGDGLVGGVC